jgi:hypothetical protein
MPRESRRAPVLIVDTGGERLLCFFGGELREVHRGSAETLDAVVALEQDWIRRLHALEARKRQFVEAFVIFVEHTNRLTSAAEVHEALLQHTPVLVGGWSAALLLPAPGSGPCESLRVVADPRITVTLGNVPCGILGPGPLLIGPADAHPGAPLAGLAGLFADCGAAYLAGVSLGNSGMLLLIERRAEREFNGEDWFRLQAAARHAEGVLERVQLREELAGRRPTRGR